MKDQKRNKLLSELEHTISQVIIDTTASAYLLAKKHSTQFAVGKYVINKKNNGLYSIKDQANTILYDDLYCVDAVFGLVECLLLNNMPRIRKILAFECEYSKQYTDMIYMKRAIENKYSAVFENRYELAKERLANAHYKIKRLRKTLF